MKKHLKFGLAAALAVVALFSLAFAGSRSAWLGVYTQEVDKDLAEDYSLASDHGAIIDDVVDDSPAEGAGLKEDDIIIAFNGKVVRDDDDLTDLVLDSRPGDTVSLTIVRDGKEQQIKVELGRRPRSYGWYGDRGWFDAPRAPRVPKIPKIPKIPAPVVPDYYYFHGDDEYPYIGVSLLEVSRKTAISLGADRGGVLIDDVEKNSPAEKAGLQAGDLIVAVDDEKIFDAEDVQEIIRDKDEGEVARITYIRDRKQSTVDVKVAIDEDGCSYRRSHIIRIPDMPDIDIKAPKLQYLHQGRFLDSDDFDSDDFKEAMKEYQKELKKLKIEMKDLNKSLH
jgi:S1-C subfamily serine protease